VDHVAQALAGDKTLQCRSLVALARNQQVRVRDHAVQELDGAHCRVVPLLAAQVAHAEDQPAVLRQPQACAHLCAPHFGNRGETYSVGDADAAFRLRYPVLQGDLAFTLADADDAVGYLSQAAFRNQEKRLHRGRHVHQEGETVGGVDEPGHTCSTGCVPADEPRDGTVCMDNVRAEFAQNRGEARDGACKRDRVRGSAQGELDDPDACVPENARGGREVPVAQGREHRGQFEALRVKPGAKLQDVLARPAHAGFEHLRDPDAPTRHGRA